MKNRTYLFWIILAMAALPLNLSAKRVETPQPEKVLETPIPGELKNLHMENPFVKAVISIDEEGNPVDLLFTWATHFALLDRAGTFLDTVSWKPHSPEGSPTAFTFEVFVVFTDFEQEAWRSSDGRFVPMGSSSLDGMKAKVYRVSPKKYVYTKSEVTEVDQPLSIVEGSIVLVEDADGNPAKGEAVVEYYVNHEGEACFPNILESSDRFVSESALKTLERIRFQKPTRKGKPTYVKVRQPFRFG